MSNTATRPAVSPATSTWFSLSVERATTCSSGFWVRGKDPRGSSGPKRSQNLACPWSLVTKVPQPRSLLLARLRRKRIWSTGALLNCILHQHSNRGRERGERVLNSHWYCLCYIRQHVIATVQQKRPPSNGRFDKTVVHSTYTHRISQVPSKPGAMHTHKTSQCMHIRRQWYKCTYV